VKTHCILQTAAKDSLNYPSLSCQTQQRISVNQRYKFPAVLKMVITQGFPKMRILCNTTPNYRRNLKGDSQWGVLRLFRYKGDKTGMEYELARIIIDQHCYCAVQQN